MGDGRCARQLLISANGVGIGTGALDASDKLVVNGPIRISDGGTRPLCTQSHRGMIWHEFGELGQVRYAPCLHLRMLRFAVLRAGRRFPSTRTYSLSGSECCWATLRGFAE
jgi:hypothetical protein